MSAVATETHNCSCGRTFPTEKALQRHTWVTNHKAAEPTLTTPAPDHSREAVKNALRILREKQAAQHNFDQQRRRDRQLLQACTQMHAQFVHATRNAEEISTSTRMLSSIRMLALMLIIGGLVVTGLNVVP
jgi:hypothetical protein